jgi:hypothetical protein
VIIEKKVVTGGEINYRDEDQSANEGGEKSPQN